MKHLHTNYQWFLVPCLFFGDVHVVLFGALGAFPLGPFGDFGDSAPPCAEVMLRRQKRTRSDYQAPTAFFSSEKVTL